MRVSRKCVNIWIDRWTAEGETGLQTRSSRPHTLPTKASPEVEHEVLTARAEQREGPDVLEPRAGVPARNVPRMLRQHGVPHLHESHPIIGEVIRASKATVVRYKRDRPGELVLVDVKKLGKIPDGG